MACVAPQIPRTWRFWRRAGAVFAACCGLVAAAAAEPLPPSTLAALRASGLPLASFGVYFRPVEPAALMQGAALNAEQPFRLASTAKLVTSLAALNLLGPAHRWRSQAYATAPVMGGRLSGDLVIVGAEGGLAPAELRQWFRQMHAQGLSEIAGRIVLERLSLASDNGAGGGDRAPPPAKGAGAAHRSLVVAVRPTRGARAAIDVSPRVGGLTIVNEVLMGGGCAAYARWGGGGSATLLVSGRWDASCGAREVAALRAPPVLAMQSGLPERVAAIPLQERVAALWAESGGRLRGRVVVEAGKGARAAPPWSSQIFSALPELIHDINKTSNNSAARSLLSSLASGTAPDALTRVRGWLRSEGLADDDIQLELGSGQSPLERGKPRALVQLLCNAWRAGHARVFIDSLPIAGVDGTLAQRLRHGVATGRAYLKTGTLSDTRALAGYVVARSGKVYALAVLVNHPQAARATPALDRLVEALAQEG
ncbi:MAG TPA: D-alanyl-D-alanine carboxypeptidase [Burkholderiaceae bacterium]|jgi:D-alanyl-D-alanine carboxypeptidase/D-alanyl-D-alanine-endopeptidase (penicillin-binding protein 4)|nr:D-alanyl-D-alanine carboxypeptidase [Burkholderiaceae bacterium]